MNRPLTWLVTPSRDGGTLLATFATVRAALATHRHATVAPRPTEPEAFYPTVYLEPLAGGRLHRSPRVTSLRRPDVTSVLVLPDRFADGTITPCGFIRLVQPFDALAARRPDVFVEVTDLDAVLHREADAVICQRHVVPTPDAAERLISHCRSHGMRLIYDLDDDLVSIPANHPEAARLTPLAKVVRRFTEAADSVWAATPELRERLLAIRPDVDVVRNAHDDRLWSHACPRIATVGRPTVQILYMGTAIHDEELEFLAPVAEALQRRFGRQVRFDVVGVASRKHLPRGFNRVVPEATGATHSYPGFVEWYCRQQWDLAVSPLVESPFNRCKSAIKLLDYAALGLPVVASRHAEYATAFGPGAGVHLVANTTAAWVEALARLVEDAEARRRSGAEILNHYRRHHTHAVQPDLVWTPLCLALATSDPQRAA